MEFEHLPEFDKDLKHLQKRYRSLEEDLVVLRKILTVEPQASPPRSFTISGLGTAKEIIKIKKIACKALKGRGANSGIRLIYALHNEEQKIVFIEIYFKGDKENEDRGRILKYYS